MELVWPFERRCILCARAQSKAVPFSRAHLVPGSLGGFAWSWTECKDCNEIAGRTIEHAAVNDDSLRLAVNALREKLPALAARFDARTRLVAQTPLGPVHARRQGDEFESLTTLGPESSRRQPREESRAALERRLRRANAGEDETEAALSLFDMAPGGTPFTIQGDTYTHTSGAGFAFPLDGQPVSAAFPSLIAFRLLAWTLGRSIYDPRLDGLRAAVRAGEPRSTWHVAESGIDRDTGYQPWHLVGIAQGAPHLVVRVQLFGWDVWRVHFPRIVGGGVPSGYRFDVDTHAMRLAAPRSGGALLALPG